MLKILFWSSRFVLVPKLGTVGACFVALVGCLLPLLSPASATAQDNASVHSVRVFLPNNHNLQWLNFWVALGAGYFADEGLEIEVVAGCSGDDEGGRGAVQALFNGSADMAVLPRPLYLIAAGQGRPVLAFANLLRNDPINLVVRRDIAEGRGLSQDLPFADRLDSIRGFEIGVAPGPLSRLRVLLAAGDLDPDHDIETVIVSGESQNEFFEEGRVDALYAHTPYLEKALVEQGAILVVNQSAGEVPELSDRQIHMLVTTRQFRRTSPEILMGMTRAIFRAQQLIHRDKESTLAAIRASGVRLQAPDALETLVEIYEPAIPLTPAVSVEGALQELALFPSRRTAPDFSSVDIAEFIDNEFAERVVADD